MANVMSDILDAFSLVYEFWCSGIQSPRIYKWLWILNWSKWIFVVDISTQILFTILLSIGLYSGCKLKVYKITHTKGKPAMKIDIFRKIDQVMTVISKIWLRMSATNIHLL